MQGVCLTPRVEERAVCTGVSTAGCRGLVGGTEGGGAGGAGVEGERGKSLTHSAWNCQTAALQPFWAQWLFLQWILPTPKKAATG